MINKEYWKDVKGFKDLYKISNYGNVLSLKTNKILKHGRKNKGYAFVNLYKDKKPKCRMVHQLMAECFLGHVPNGQTIVVDHIDNNQSNNRLDNLQLITQRGNSLKDKDLPKSGYIGVYWNSQNKKWQVRPRVNNKKFFVGYFDCPKYAAEVYKDFTYKVDSGNYTIEELKKLKEYYKEQIKKL